MLKRRLSITEQYSPTFRRRVGQNYLSLSLPYPHEQFQVDDNQDVSPLTMVLGDNQGSSVHESGPRNMNHFIDNHISHKKDHRIDRANMNLLNFIKNNGKIQKIIDEVDQIIRKRMQAHEQGLLTVVKSQIDKMQQQCKNIVREYNQMIRTKNKQTQIYSIKNQLEYFRAEALVYFQQNKKLKAQNKNLRDLVKNKDSIIEDLNLTIKRTTKKYLRQKAILHRIQKQQQYSKEVNKGIISIKDVKKQRQSKDKDRIKSNGFYNTVKKFSSFATHQVSTTNYNCQSKNESIQRQTSKQRQNKKDRESILQKYQTFSKFKKYRSKQINKQQSFQHTKEKSQSKEMNIKNSKRNSEQKIHQPGKSKDKNYTREKTQEIQGEGLAHRQKNVKTTFTKFYTTQKNEINEKKGINKFKANLQHFRVKKQVETEGDFVNNSSIQKRQKQFSAIQMAKIRNHRKSKSFQKFQNQTTEQNNNQNQQNI